MAEKRNIRLVGRRVSVVRTWGEGGRDELTPR